MMARSRCHLNGENAPAAGAVNQSMTPDTAGLWDSADGQQWNHSRGNVLDVSNIAHMDTPCTHVVLTANMP